MKMKGLKATIVLTCLLLGSLASSNGQPGAPRLTFADFDKLHKELTTATDATRLDPFGDPLPPGARLRLGRTFGW